MQKINVGLIGRYLISGGLGAITQLSFLYLFHGRLEMWYLSASFLSNLIAFVVGFTAQKFWTFRERSGSIHKQAFGYGSLLLVNIVLNLLLMYIFVDFFHIWYIAAQILSNGLIAIQSFFVYRHIIFKPAA